MKKSRFGFDEEIATVESLQGSTEPIDPIETVPIEDAMQQRIMSLPFLSESLPHIFTDGSGVIDRLSVNCANCGEEIHSKSIKGQFIPKGSEMVKIEGYGLCFNCKTVTPLSARFNNDGTYVFSDSGGWSRGVWGQGVTPSRLLFRKTANYIRRNWSTILPPVIATGLLILWIYVRIQ